VTLVAVSAVGLQGRRGLDWGELADVPEVPLARAGLGAAGGLFALIVARQLLRIWRQLRPRRSRGGAERVHEGWPVNWVTRLVAGLLVVCWVAFCYVVISMFVDDFPGDSSIDGPRPRGALGDVPSGGVLPLLTGLLTVLVVAAILSRALHRRRRADADLAEEGDVVEVSALAGAVVAAEQALESSRDAREAIIAAYREMARELARSTGRASDTPMELLDGAVRDGLVSRGAALDLTELFRLARFSRHPVPDESRADAEAALARVADELSVRRG